MADNIVTQPTSPQDIVSLQLSEISKSDETLAPKDGINAMLGLKDDALVRSINTAMEASPENQNQNVEHKIDEPTECETSPKSESQAGCLQSGSVSSDLENTSTSKSNIETAANATGYAPAVESNDMLAELSTQTVSAESLVSTAAHVYTDSAASMVDQLMRGRCAFDNLPALPKKVVRIFVSSTFTDTKEERNALMQHVYPRLADYCRDKHGLEFQIVDMRWGVPEQASDNHSTTDLCIQEIHKCQQVSVGPSFVAIVGDKYGYRPIPSAIDEPVFDIIAEAAVSSDTAHSWATVQQWYLKDDNSLPPCYLLQPISSQIPNYNSETQELRKAATEEWNSINKTLTDALRRAAEGAHSLHRLTDKQKQKFFMSVTESEITEGILEGKGQATETSYCIMRNISDIEQHLHEPNAPRFTDLTHTRDPDYEAIGYLKVLKHSKLAQALPQSNLAKVEITWSNSGANISLENTKDVDVAKYAQKLLKDKELHVHKHRQYLDGVCDKFFKTISKMIQQGSVSQDEMYDELTTEVLQHAHLAKLRCDVFEGRDEILARAKAYLEIPTQHGPLVIYGNSGCGKTSIIAKIMQLLEEMNVNGSSKFVVLARFLGTTTNTCNVHQLLVSLCRQLCLIYDQTCSEPDELRDLIKLFHSLLKLSTEKQPLVIILDSIDQILPTYNAYKLNWIPKEVPKYVKIIASTIEEGYPILKNFKENYSAPYLTAIEVTPLGETLGMQVIKRWLDKAHRTFTAHQETVISSALSQCSLPLYARIAFDHIVKWKSYDTPRIEQLQTTVKGAINRLFESMEEKFGDIVVKHCLAYLTASRNGLSEAELEHLLSMDDILLNTVFKLWNPPVRRIPPLIWTRVRSEINNYIVERSADDIHVLYWYHRQFIQTTKQRYLSDAPFEKHIHGHLVDYFSGKWSGKEKPFTYTDAQITRFGLDNGHSAADRKLPVQAYQTQVQQHGAAYVRYNKRKLSELPYHLVKCNSYTDMKRMIFFNYEWLYNKVKCSSVQQMLEEFDVFMQSDKFIKKDVEMKILYANLQLMRPDILRYPESLSYELQGTLSKYIGKYEHLSDLVNQCDMIGIKLCPIVPISSCFKSADLGFTQNIHFRRSEPSQLGGTFTCTSDFKTLYIIDYDKNGLPMLIIWDLSSGEKVNQMAITKSRTEENTTDVYWQVETMLSGKRLIAFYQVQLDNTYQQQLRKGSGYCDLINVDTGAVEQTFDCFMYRDDFLTPLIYRTDSYMCVINGWKKHLINVTTTRIQNLNRPSLVSADQRLFILCGKDKTIVQENGGTKDLAGEFDLPESQTAVTASLDFTVLAFMGSESKDISVFDMSNKQMKTKKRYFQLFKPKHIFKLDVRAKDLVKTVCQSITHTNEKGLTEEVTNNHVLMQISPDKRHLLVIFVGWKWTAFLWCLNIGKFGAKFVGNITEGIMGIENKLPQFNFDGSAVLYNTTKQALIALDSDTGQQMNQYTIQEDIKDFRTCPTMNKVVVMLQKSIIILDMAKTDVTPQVKSRKATQSTEWPDVLLEREICWDMIHKEVVCRQTANDLQLEEVSDLAESADTDRIASARSKRQHALAKYTTPDGLRTVHYHSRVQVIDTKSDEVKYSPKKGDSILRVKTENGVSSNETVEIPGINASLRFITLDLLQGDRIVNENNKIKFRINKEPNGQFKILTVPSVLTVYTTEELKLRKIQRIEVYKETVLSCSNNYIVTAKHTQFGHFVNVYSQSDGKVLATHRSTSLCESAAFSTDGNQLFTVDRALNVRLITGPHFTTIEQHLGMKTAAQMSSAFVIKSIVTFQQDNSSVLVQYGPEGSHALVQSRYVHVNLTTKEQSVVMLIAPGFLDMSPDGSLGVDPVLNIYDLQKGLISRKIPYSRSRGSKTGSTRKATLDEDAGSQICARISADKNYVVFIDRQDASLHLISLVGNTCRTIVSCNSHAVDLRHGGLTMRQFGRLIELKTTANTLRCVICTHPPKTCNYDSETSRAKLLVTTIEEICSKSEQVKATDGRSVYQRRALMLNQIGGATASNEQKSTTAQPVILVLGEPILCSSIFKENTFSFTITAEKVTCQDVDEAIVKLQNIAHYDAIVLQLVTNDVIKYDVDTCVSKVEAVVQKAQQSTKLVLISEAPCRSDNKELNEKTLQVNDKLEKLYPLTRRVARRRETVPVLICNNSNLSIADKPNPKYFQDSVNLSPQGLMKLIANLKRALAPHLNMHHI